MLQVCDPNEDSVSEPTLTGPDHELVVDTTLSPDEIKERAVGLRRELQGEDVKAEESVVSIDCLLYTSPSPRDGLLSRMPSSA